MHRHPRAFRFQAISRVLYNEAGLTAALPALQEVNAYMREDLLRISYTHLILECIR